MQENTRPIRQLLSSMHGTFCSAGCGSAPAGRPVPTDCRVAAGIRGRPRLGRRPIDPDPSRVAAHSGSRARDCDPLAADPQPPLPGVGLATDEGGAKQQRGSPAWSFSVAHSTRSAVDGSTFAWNSNGGSTHGRSTSGCRRLQTLSPKRSLRDSPTWCVHRGVNADRATPSTQGWSTEPSAFCQTAPGVRRRLAGTCRRQSASGQCSLLQRTRAPHTTGTSSGSGVPDAIDAPTVTRPR